MLATGGPSIPKMGATGFAYELAKNWGLKLVEPRPALVPLTLRGEDALFRKLSGVSTEVVASATRGPPGPVRPSDSSPANFFLGFGMSQRRASSSATRKPTLWGLSA